MEIVLDPSAGRWCKISGADPIMTHMRRHALGIGQLRRLVRHLEGKHGHVSWFVSYDALVCQLTC